MSFVIKVISFIVIIITLYILGIFLLPAQADFIASKIWILSLNEKIRWAKTGVDEVSDTLIQMKDAESNIDYARDVMDKTVKTIDSTKKTVEQKIEQTEKVIESSKKVIDSTKELKQNVDNLTTISWSEK